VLHEKAWERFHVVSPSSSRRSPGGERAHPAVVRILRRAGEPGRPHRDARRTGVEAEAALGTTRQVELVWRRETPSSPVDAAAGPTIRSVADPHDSPNERRDPQPTPQEPAAPLLRASQLDPFFVERLTDDVIHRVERRARIERERRGL
jgi:hypothetical protein